MLIILLLKNNLITKTQLIDFFIKMKVFNSRKYYLKSILVLLGYQKFLDNIIFIVINENVFIQLGVVNKRHFV